MMNSVLGGEGIGFVCFLTFLKELPRILGCLLCLMGSRGGKDHFFLVSFEFSLLFLDNLLRFRVVRCLRNVKNFRGVRFMSFFTLILCN